MAEAFGLVAGVLQVAGFGAELGSALWTCARKIRYANKELEALASQVDATAKCLGSVGSLLDDPETRTFHTPKLYEDTRAVSRGCDEIFLELHKAIRKFNDDGHKMSVVARLQWPLSSNKLAESLKILKNYNNVLHLMLAVLQIVEGRRAATSEELRTLGASLDRLTISNESLSRSNNNLTDILYSNEQTLRHSVHPEIATLAPPTEGPSLDRLDGSPFVSGLVLPDLPKTGLLKSRQSLPFDATHDHLQRCMDSVQELAKTIAYAMSAWQGHDKTGNSDILGTHAKVVVELMKLPAELECIECSGHVSWSHFDLVRAATECLGTCICVGRTLSAHWRPSTSIIPHSRRAPSASPLSSGTSSHDTLSPNANVKNLSSFHFNQIAADQNSSLDPALHDPNGLNLFQPQQPELDSSLDPMATTTMQSHNPTPPRLFPEISHRQSISPSPHASPHPHPPYNQSFADTNLLSADSFTTLNDTAHSAHFADPGFTQDLQHQPDYSLGQYNGFQTQQQPPNLSSQNSDASNHTFLQSANGGDNSYGFNQPAQPSNHLSLGASSHNTPSPGANVNNFASFDFNQTTFDHSSSLDPALLNPNGLDLLQPQLDSSLDPIATTTMQSHNPTPPHLFPEISHRQSISPSPHASPHMQQASFQNVSNMSRPRGTSESLDPSSAAYPQGKGNEWLGMGGYRAHQRSPLDQLSDISSAHNSPCMQTLDSFDHSSPMLNPSADPSFSDGLGLGHFSLNDPQNAAQKFYSLGHNPAVSPRLMPQQNELPAFTADNNFGMASAMSSQFGQPNDGPEMFPSYGHDLFPAYGHSQPTSPMDLGAADQMSPPKTSIDYAPPTKDSHVNRPSRSIADEETPSPPIRQQSRNRIRAKSDSHAGSRPMAPSHVGRGRSLSLQPPISIGSLAPYDDKSTPPRISSPARGRNGSLSSRNGRSSSNASDQRDYILDLAYPERMPSNGAKSHRQQKHPATFQCTLCPKRFTRAYNLRSHLRTHTGERPFVCTLCGKAFAHQHDRKRHEGLHSGEKKSMCRGTLQSSASWGCGRRFACADALGRHFWSEAGRVCIKALLDEEAAERQKAWLAEQQQARFAPQPLLAQPHMNMMDEFIPAAVLQQYPALAALDWNALPQGPPPDEEAYSGRSSFHISSDGEMLEVLNENEHVMCLTQNVNIGGSVTADHDLDMLQQGQISGKDRIQDYGDGLDGSDDVNETVADNAAKGKSDVQALLIRWLGYEATSTLFVGAETISSSY